MTSVSPWRALFLRAFAQEKGEAQDAKSRAIALKAMAEKVGYKYDYLYQIYEQKSGKGEPGTKLVQKLMAAYPELVDAGGEPSANNPQNTTALRDALGVVHMAAKRMSGTRRLEIAKLLEVYLGDPETYKELLIKIEVVMLGELDAIPKGMRK